MSAKSINKSDAKVIGLSSDKLNDKSDIPKKSLVKRVKKIKPSKHIKTTRKTFDKAAKVTMRHINKFLLGRWDNLRLARRAMIGWLSLMAVLIAVGAGQALLAARNLQTTAPASGGTYAEGVVDKITTINPLFAATDSERAASQLVYSSLLTYDETNNLRGDLATTWTISDDGKSWNVKLRPGVLWSDGQPLTADDVIFTVGLIKNPAVGSPLNNSWRTVEIEKVNSLEVKFTLSNTYMSFPFALTFGILPQHIFKNIAPVEIRNITSDPDKMVGSGRFVLKARETLANGQALWRFVPNDHLVGARSRIAVLTIRTYADDQGLLDGLNRHEINAAAGISVKTAAQDPGSNLIQAPLASGIFAMFNNASPILSDPTVREALHLGTDRVALRKASVSGDLKMPEPLETPIAPGIFSSVDALKQPDFNREEAAKKLDEAGWVIDDKNVRAKDGQTLTLNLVTIKNADYTPAARNLVKQWKALGIDANLTEADPATVQQNYLIARNYDVLIYQLYLGMDPDVYAYWSSSQTLATGLNFANYKSIRADLALSAGRTQQNPVAREARYADFVKQWLSDAPAIALYRPNFYYAKSSQLNTMDDTPLVSGANRFRNIEFWTVQNATVNVTP